MIDLNSFCIQLFTGINNNNTFLNFDVVGIVPHACGERIIQNIANMFKD